MEVGTVPPQAPVGGLRGPSLTLLKEASDCDLVALIRAGNGAAFEALDARYRSAMLRYCRRLLADPDEAEDAVQHTFMAAYTAIKTSDDDVELRPWLYVIARNRCYSILRGRREVAMAELDHGTSEEPGALVERREDLRDLVLDVNRLPDDQRAALVMAELGAHSHDEIAGVLEVPRAKVKALVFQARESLVATRTAREIDCADIRRQLCSVRGAALRRGTLRRHLHDCPGCREYRRQLRYQRAQFAALLPAGPWLALRSLLSGSAHAERAAPVATGAGTASTAVKLGALKPIAGALAAMLSAASAVVAVHSIAHRPVRVPAHVAHHRAPAPSHARETPGIRARTPSAVRRRATGVHRTAARVSVARPAAVVVHRRLIGRTAWIDRRMFRRVASYRAFSRTRVIVIHPHPSVPPPTLPSPTAGGPAVPLPVLPALPALPQVPVAVPPVTPPLVVHGPNVPPTGPHGGPGDPGPGNGPGDPGHDRPGNRPAVGLPPVVNPPVPAVKPVPLPSVPPVGTTTTPAPTVG